MNKKSIVILLCFFLLSTTFSFAESSLTKEYDVTVKTKDIENKAIDKKYKRIKVDGKEYKMKEFEYIHNKPKTIKKKYKDLTEKEVEKKINLGGQEYKLNNVKYDKKTVTKTDTYSNYITEPQIPKEKDIEIEDGKTVKGTLKNTERNLSSTYNVPFTMPAKFYGSEGTEVYVLNGKEISSYNAPEFRNYPNEILNYLNLDGNIYRIDRGAWQGGYYNENGQTVRNAVYSGMQKSNIYTATYEYETFYATATYENLDLVDSTLKVTYEKIGLTRTQKILIAGAVVFTALLISLILFILKKKSNKEQLDG